MAFSFSSPSPAPAAGSLFGSSTPAAPNFGTPGPASAPLAFGATPAASVPTAFGAAPAPFGSPAPAPVFGAAPAPFGAVPAPFGAPAPSTAPFGTPAPAFGTSAPASSLGATAPSTFGAPAFGAPAPFGSSAPASAFGTAPAPNAANQLAARPTIAGSMRYRDLPPHFQQSIDQIHAAMTQHRQTLHGLHNVSPRIPNMDAVINVENMNPARLQGITSAALTKAEEEAVRSVVFVKWPLEALQVQRGEEKKSDDSLSSRLRAALHQSLATRVDRINRMPLPVLWDLIHEAEERLHQLEATAQKLHVEHEQTKSLLEGKQSLQNVIEMQHWKIDDYKKNRIPWLQQAVEKLRFHYKRFESEGANVLDKAQIERQDTLQKQMVSLQKSYLQVSNAGASGPVASAVGGAAPAPLFGAAPAPLFGAPAPSTGGSLFGGTASAPAPAFGATPAPVAPAFGASATPAAGFGASTTAPAPPAFGATPAPAFGATPAPAFGATLAPVPAPAFGAPAATGTSWASSKPSKSGRRGKK